MHKGNHPGYPVSNRLHELFWKRVENKANPMPHWVRRRMKEYAIARGKAEGIASI